MQLLPILITALTLMTGALAQEKWHGCAGGFFCNNNDECRAQEDCQNTAGGNADKIFCGGPNHPHACFAYYPTTN
ncbi:hypothetical protein BDV28DRAFT_132450 [Aspergillus coremiiformis]|uniref:Extracellular membrane protein CFEM domain-containing protein n=1 Tax=Aspergillus coremiiformis TaxID=138285 RepID=A0A5N6Z9F1_9EURO|nr:hypothetical protein BDV28DRAFT_132450 [Aspergillus coremiiformis]